MTRKDRVNLFVLATLSSRCTRATFDALGYIPDFDQRSQIFKSQDRVHRALERESDVEIKHFDMCRNECLLFFEQQGVVASRRWLIIVTRGRPKVK